MRAVRTQMHENVVTGLKKLFVTVTDHFGLSMIKMITNFILFIQFVVDPLT